MDKRQRSLGYDTWRRSSPIWKLEVSMMARLQLPSPRRSALPQPRRSAAIFAWSELHSISTDHLITLPIVRSIHPSSSLVPIGRIGSTVAPSTRKQKSVVCTAVSGSVGSSHPFAEAGSGIVTRMTSLNLQPDGGMQGT